MNEKYHEYLCSRAWALKREAVYERTREEDGISRCERCLWRKGKSVHHLTYARLYNEELTDLVLLCDVCHAYQHGKENELDISKIREEAKEWRDEIEYAMKVAGIDRDSVTLGAVELYSLADCHNPAWRARLRK